MKIYEKPMALVNKFEIEDVIAASAGYVLDETGVLTTEQQTYATENSAQGVVFQW